MQYTEHKQTMCFLKKTTILKPYLKTNDIDTLTSDTEAAYIIRKKPPKEIFSFSLT